MIAETDGFRQWQAARKPFAAIVFRFQQIDPTERNEGSAYCVIWHVGGVRANGAHIVTQSANEDVENLLKPEENPRRRFRLLAAKTTLLALVETCWLTRANGQPYDALLSIVLIS